MTLFSWSRSKDTDPPSIGRLIHFPDSLETATSLMVMFRCSRSGTGASVTRTTSVPVLASTRSMLKLNGRPTVAIIRIAAIRIAATTPMPP